ncbi:MAG: tRNA guanosine(34) transglycosylase Tgt [Candidatus Omnitrophota bacterium]
MFTLIKTDKATRARTGVFCSKHGKFSTPAFFPVATQAAIKGLSAGDISDIGIEGLLVNAYHLYLRPGVKIIKECGGLHAFMNFKKAIITDSGGYQIFSLNALRSVSDKGVSFKSHIDGRRIFLTPEDIMQAQIAMGSDIVVPLDECIKLPATYLDARRAMLRSLDWAGKSKAYFKKHASDAQLFFGIVQGATFNDLRKQCLERLMDIGIDGFCIGGLSVGESADLRYNTLSYITENADKEYLRYFMGYGKPEGILEAVSLGIDLFDCILPTRLGRTGTAFTDRGKVILRDSPYASDTGPIDSKCACSVCREYSRAYIRHLFNAKEMLGAQLLTYHNVFWYNNFMKRIRTAIEDGSFVQFKKDFLSNYCR